MDRLTYRDIVRTYADNVRNRHADTDLTQRQAKFTALVLTTASNDGATSQPYPLAEDVTQAVVTRTLNLFWDGNVSLFLDIASQGAREDFDVAVSRAVTILKGV